MKSTLKMVPLVTLNGNPIIKRETEKAILIEIRDEWAVWMPKSQIKGFWQTPYGVWMAATPFIVEEKGLGHGSYWATEQDIYEALNEGTGAWI